MQHPGTYTGPFGLQWGEKEQTVSAPVPLMTRTVLSQNPGILASEGNPASHVRADGNGNKSAVLTDWKPWSGLSLYSRGPVLEILMGYKSYASFPN